MSAILLIAALATAPAATQYCEARVASIPALERDEAKVRCEAVFTEFLAMHDRVDGLSRLAQLEAWLRLREQPLTEPPTLRECDQALQRKEPELRREATDELVRRRIRAADRHPIHPDERRPSHKRIDGDLMNPFDNR